MCVYHFGLSYHKSSYCWWYKFYNGQTCHTDPAPNTTLFTTQPLSSFTYPTVESLTFLLWMLTSYLTFASASTFIALLPYQCFMYDSLMKPPHLKFAQNFCLCSRLPKMLWLCSDHAMWTETTLLSGTVSTRLTEYLNLLFDYVSWVFCSKVFLFHSLISSCNNNTLHLSSTPSQTICIPKTTSSRKVVCSGITLYAHLLQPSNCF